MNTGRVIGAALAVWLVRSVLNGVFYTQIVGGEYEKLFAAHPGVFREVIPAFVAADLLFAVVFVLLFAKVGSALGAGVKAGVTLGLFVAILSPVLGNIYMFYSFAVLPGGMAVADSVFQVIAHGVEGAAAGLTYKD